jgi:hypothetical protein
MLLVRSLIILGLTFVVAACNGAKGVVVARGAGWQLIKHSRATPSHQHIYILTYQGELISARGDLSTPVGTYMLSAPTDQYADSGWIQVSPKTSLMFPTKNVYLTRQEFLTKQYDVDGAWKKSGTPSTWVFLARDSGGGTWLDPNILTAGRH